MTSMLIGCHFGTKCPLGSKAKQNCRDASMERQPFILNMELNDLSIILSSSLADKRDIVVTIFVQCMCVCLCSIWICPDHNL